MFLFTIALYGGYLARVFAWEKTFLDPALRPVDRGIYSILLMARCPTHAFLWRNIRTTPLTDQTSWCSS